MLRASVMMTGFGVLIFWKSPLPEPKEQPYLPLPVPPYNEHPNQHFLTKIPEKIGIIGAGICGIITAKELLLQGYEVEILEKNSDLGGVWNVGYENQALQGPYPHYELPDYKFPEGTNFFATAPEVKEFIRGYSEKFGVFPHIKFNSEMMGLSQNEDGTWNCLMKDGTCLKYDFLILCNGLFHIPNIPEFKGQENFKGTIIHSSRVADAKSIGENKKVIVIGGAKSACDMVRLFDQYSSDVTLVSRRNGLNASGMEKVFGRGSFDILSWRTTNLFLYQPHGGVPFFSFWPWISKKFVEILVQNEKLPEELRCTSDITKELPIGLYKRDSIVVEKIRNKEVKFVEGEIEYLREREAVINGVSHEVDVIVCATGFESTLYSFHKKEEGLLYKNMISPYKKNIIFLSSWVSRLGPLFFNIKAVWVSEILRGKVKLPSQEEMVKSAQENYEFCEKYLGKKTYNGISSSNTLSDIDHLLRDMGIKAYRKESLFKNWFSKPTSDDYLRVVTHRV